MKTLSFVLIALVGLMVLNLPVQSYADPQLDTLLRIATQARDHLSIAISQINNVPNEITNLYNQGSSETDGLAKSVDQQDVASAKQHFLSAMQFFKATNDKINSLNATASTEPQRPDIIQLQSEILRIDSIGKRLKTIAIANQADIDFTQLDQFVQTARQDLDAGNIENASKAIQDANQFLNDVHHSLTLVAKQRTSDRAKDFTEKEIQRFNQTIPNTVQNMTSITPLPTAPIQNNTNVTQEESPQQMVAKIRKFMSEGKVDEAINVIKSLESYQKEKIKANENSGKTSTSGSANVTAANQTITNSTTTKPANETTIHSIPSNSTNTSTNSTKISNETVTKKIDSSQATSSGNVGSGQEDNIKKNLDKKHGQKNSQKSNHDQSD